MLVTPNECTTAGRVWNAKSEGAKTSAADKTTQLNLALFMGYSSFGFVEVATVKRTWESKAFD